MKESSFDITILGGGILGVSLAYHLRKSNLRILLIEKDQNLGLHASGKNAGMIRQLYRSEQLTEWAKNSINYWPKEIKSNFFTQGSSLIIGRNIPNHNQELFKETNIKISGRSIKALYTKTDGLLDSSPYLNYLATEAKKNKQLEIMTNTSVSSISRPSLTTKELEMTINGQYKITTSLLVNCTGAWLDKTLEQTTDIYKIRKIRFSKAYARYLFRSKGWGNSNSINSNSEEIRFNDTSFYWDEENNWYCRDWGEGEKLISKCEELEADPDDYIPNLNAQLRLSETFCKLYPEFSKNITLENGWHCFRTYTKDKLPIFGFDKDEPRLFWLGCFGGFGMSTSYSATYDAAQLLTKKSNNKFSEFSPDRLIQKSIS